MKHFWVVSPEVPGDWGPHIIVDRSVHPPKVTHLHFEFLGWLGSDLITTFPCYLVTERLRGAIEDAGCSGCCFGDAEVSLDEQFERTFQMEMFPRFWWLKVQGAAGEDDFGTRSDGRLVVSDKALEVLNRHKLVDCYIVPFKTEYT